MTHSYAAIEFDDQDGHFIRKLWRLREFAECFPELGTYDSVRKRVEKRHANGLAARGAIVECRLGILIDPDRYKAWLLEPRPAEQGDESDSSIPEQARAATPEPAPAHSGRDSGGEGA